MVKHLSAMQDTWLQSLDWEDSLEEKMVIPVQYSCLENLMDRGTSLIIVHWIAKESDMT